MKKTVLRVLLVLALMLTAFASTASASNPISVLLNGKTLSFPQPPIIESGRTLVPMRVIFEELGATVDWDGATRTITATAQDLIIIMQVGNNVFTRNGEEVTLDVAPKIVNGSTLVPVRAVAESFDADVRWNQLASIVTIQVEDNTPQINFREVVATANGHSIRAGEVMVRTVMAQENVKLDGITQNSENFNKAVLEESVRLSVFPAILSGYAEKNNITVSAEKQREVQEEVKEMVDLMSGEKGFLAFFSTSGFQSVEHYTYLVMLEELMDAVKDAILADSRLFEEFRNHMDSTENEDEELLAAKHILIKIDDFEDIMKAMEFAISLQERAVAGEDFDELIAEYGKDPGMQSNPQGYTFVSKVMVDEFEAATRGLKIGEISEAFFSVHGIHIVLRVEPNPDNVMLPHQPYTDEDKKVVAIMTSFQMQAQDAAIEFLPGLYNLPIVTQ